MAAKPLTAVMVAALAEITVRGGEVVRFQGGFWSWRNVARNSHNGWPVESFGTTTIRGLVDRGELVYSEWREGRGGRFPIAARLAKRGEE